MSILQRAIGVVTEAEASLRRMIGEAAENGDYSSVETLARWAQNLNDLCSESIQSWPATAKPASAPVAIAHSKPVRTSGKRRSYPLFAKSSDTLVKIGWSKSSKSEYQHKSPRAVLTELVAALAKQGKNGSVVSMDKILPLKLGEDSEVPDYQVYVGLAWIRQIGAVKQNGRQGYTINNPGELTNTVEAAWSKLPDAKPY